MIETTDLYKEILAGTHYKEWKLDIAGVEYTEANIVSASIPPVGLFEKFGIGNCVARELDIEILPISDIPRQAEIKVFVRLVGNGAVSEWLPQGVFFISTRQKDKLTGALSIVAFDAMLKAEEVWITSDYADAEWPWTNTAVVEDIANRMGVEIDARTILNDKYPVDYPVDEYGDMTMREVLAGVAVGNGGNWIISNTGSLLLLTLSHDRHSFDLGNSLEELNVGKEAMPISRVDLIVDSETYYTAGDDTGGTLEAECPWGTQALTDSLLSVFKGYIYEPYEGTNALLDPSVEMGDTFVIDGKRRWVALLGRNLDRQAAATVGAPTTDEIDDEYPYKSKGMRKTDRLLAVARSLITKTANEIRLSVEGIEDKVTSLSVTLDGVTIEDETGKTLIKGSSIDTSTLNVDNIVVGSGSITWEKLSGDVQDGINDAYSMAEDAQGAIEGWTVETADGTYIDGGMIYSESIYADALHLGGDLTIYETLASNTEGGRLGYTTSALDDSAGMHMLSANGMGEVVVTDNGAKIMFSSESNQVYVAEDAMAIAVGGLDYMRVYGSSGKVALGGSIWDFTGVTEVDFTDVTVHGLTAATTTAVFA